MIQQGQPGVLSILALLSLVFITWTGCRLAEQDPFVVFCQEPVEGTPEWVCGRRRVEGSRIVSLSANGTISVLTPDFASACDPCLSFDGTRLLFAGKRGPTDRWNIYETGLDGSGIKQITEGLGDCLEPIYLAPASVNPPEFTDRVRWIAFTSTAAGGLDDRGERVAPSLYAMSLSPVKGRGTVLWRTTYNLGGDVAPAVLGDGRVLFTSRQRATTALMTITWGGDNINLFYGTEQSPAIKTMACELPDRTIVFVESDGMGPDEGGRLARVSLRRPLNSHKVLSQGDDRYRTPQPFPGGKLAVSCASEGGDYGLYFFDFEAGGRGNKLYDDPRWHDVDAVPIAPRPEPMARIPMLEFASVLDKPGFEGLAQLHCLDVYDSDQPEIAELKPGEVKWARFIEGIPQTVAGDHVPTGSVDGDKEAPWPPPAVRTRPLGDVPVEPDGSFFVNIVGNTPFFIQLLNADKQVLHSMRAWTWVRSASQRGCIGCHENKELSPRNRATDALIKMQPVTLTRTESNTAVE